MIALFNLLVKAYKGMELNYTPTVMSQRNNDTSELEIKLSSNMIDAVMGAMNLNLSDQQLQDFKE